MVYVCPHLLHPNVTSFRMLCRKTWIFYGTTCTPTSATAAEISVQEQFGYTAVVRKTKSLGDVTTGAVALNENGSALLPAKLVLVVFTLINVVPSALERMIMSSQADCGSAETLVKSFGIIMERATSEPRLVPVLMLCTVAL